MRKFSIILPDEVVDYRRFFWRTKWDDYSRFLVSLVGFKLCEEGIQPIYQPVVSIKCDVGDFLAEVQFSRWTRFILQINHKGIRGKWEDIRK